MANIKPEVFVLQRFLGDSHDYKEIFARDSILKYLMDPWKNKTLKYKERDTELARHLLQLHQISTDKRLKLINEMKNQFTKRIEVLQRPNELFDHVLTENLVQMLGQCDEKIIEMTLHYYAIMEEVKRLVLFKADHMREALNLKMKLEKFSKLLCDFSTILEYETRGNIKIMNIKQDTPKFNKFEQLVHEKSVPDFFADSDFSGLKLVRLFKIENVDAKHSFHEKTRLSRSTIINNLFISIRKKRILPVPIFGFRSSEYIKKRGTAHYIRNYLKLPPTESAIPSYIEACDGIKAKLWGSSHSTLHRDKEKLGQNKNSLIFLMYGKVLFRKKDKTTFNQATNEFELREFSHILPDYILICTKVKTKFVLPEVNHIIPVRLCELNDCRDVEEFFDRIDKAIDHSVEERKKLKIALLQYFESLRFSVRYEDRDVKSILSEKFSSEMLN